MGTAFSTVFGLICAAAPNWGDIISRADIVFDTTCPTMTSSRLVSKYARRDPHVVQMPQGNRFMVLSAGDVFIPGTDFGNPSDILANMDATPQFDAELGARFHTGAMLRARLLRRRLADMLDSEIPVRLTGYSLGGAVAVVLGLYLEIDGFTVESTLTFGQFPVTTTTAATRFSEKPVLRVKSGLDGIPDLHSVSFSHFGDMLVLLDGPMFAHVRQGDAGFMFATQFHGINPFVDHDTYLGRLQGKATGAVEATLSVEHVTSVDGRICHPEVR